MITPFITIKITGISGIKQEIFTKFVTLSCIHRWKRQPADSPRSLRDVTRISARVWIQQLWRARMTPKKNVVRGSEDWNGTSPMNGCLRNLREEKTVSITFEPWEDQEWRFMDSCSSHSKDLSYGLVRNEEQTWTPAINNVLPTIHAVYLHSSENCKSAVALHDF